MVRKQIFQGIFEHFQQKILHRSQLIEIIEQNEEALIKDKLTLRASGNKLYGFCYSIITHPLFTMFMALVILFNTVALAYDHYKIDKSISEFLDLVNLICFVIFVVELVLKLLGLGFK